MRECPFCGELGRTEKLARHPEKWRALCSNFDCHVESYADGDTEAEAIAAWNTRPPAAPADLAARIRSCASDALRAFDDLVAQSHGVVGLHLNGDVAPWDELLSGGRFEEWLRDMEALRAVLREAALAASAAGDVRAFEAGVDGWLPIESAPRDGREVLVWNGYHQDVRYWGRHYSEMLRGDVDAWWTGYCGQGGRWPAEDVTHWRPLPEPPPATATEAGNG